jgi:hypothetical protein
MRGDVELVVLDRVSATSAGFSPFFTSSAICAATGPSVRRGRLSMMLVSAQAKASAKSSRPPY